VERAPGRKKQLVLLGIATAVFYIPLVIIDQRLKDTGGPSIVEFEFVGSLERAEEMLAEWGAEGRDDARWSLWIDFGFMAAYGALLAVAALAIRDFARERGLRRLAAAGVAAPFVAVAAALFDAAENTALLLILGGHGGSVAPPLATAFASVKFVLLIVAIGYVVWGLVSRFRQRKVEGGHALV
jgi:hypothetical protein